jgi:hypothetical protein
LNLVPRAVVILAAAFLAAAAPLSFAEDSDAAYLRKNILEEKDLFAANAFLSDSAGQEKLKASDPMLYQEVFLIAAELKDLQGLLGGASDARSIRLSLLVRQSCLFCLDPVALPAWATRHLSFITPEKIDAIEGALWNWKMLSGPQQAWVVGHGKKEAWEKMAFLDRHELIRQWALAERADLLKANPADDKVGLEVFARAQRAEEALGKHEMTEVWKRLDQARQAVSSLAAARAKAGVHSDPRQKALLDEAIGAESPEARLAALARFFDNIGERPRELLGAAPPRADQRFDAGSREIVGSMLKTALLKETAGTFAGGDLKEFYVDKGVPLEIKLMNTTKRFLGWYVTGTNTLNFNERYVEEYLKSRGRPVADLKSDPDLLGDLARTLVGTFVHEGQHHRQDVWARENKVPHLFPQAHEVEAFQVQALFLMEKMDHDPKFRAFADAEVGHSTTLREGLERARRMKEEGPDYFDWTVPNSHYPEMLSNEGHAWCNILWHNRIANTVEKELARRRSLSADEQTRLDAGSALKEGYVTFQLFSEALPIVGSASLRDFATKAKEDAKQAPEVYAKLRTRQEAVKKVTMERFKILDSEGNRVGAKGPPSPILHSEGE